MANIIFKSAIVNINGNDFVINKEDILKYWLEGDDEEGATVAIVLFGNNWKIANKLNKYFNAKHNVSYVGYEEEEISGCRTKIIGEGQAMLRALALKYGVSVQTLEKVAEAQWLIDIL